MASEFPPTPSFEIPSELCSLDKILLFSTARGAQTYLAEVEPLQTIGLVMSADGLYPKDQALWQRAHAALRENSDVKVAVFGISALRNLPLATERLLVMDDFLMQEFRKHPADREMALGLDPLKLSFLLRTFFLQWDRFPRLGNPDFAYRHFAEYNIKKFDWRAELLGIDLQSESWERGAGPNDPSQEWIPQA